MRFVPAPVSLGPDVLGLVILRAGSDRVVRTPAHAAGLFTAVFRGSLCAGSGPAYEAGHFFASGSAGAVGIARAGAGTVCATLVCRASILPRLWATPAHALAGTVLPWSGLPAPRWKPGLPEEGDAAVAKAMFDWAACLLRAARAPRASAERFAVALAGWRARSAAGLQARPPEGWSDRNWQRACRDELGVTPKLLLRLARLHASVERQSRQPRPWAEHALDLGFFDQAHLAREYRLLAGMQPTGGLAEPALVLGARQLAPRFFGGEVGGFFQA